MTAQEVKATLAIAGLFGLRLLGIFIVLPLLSLYAQQLAGATPVLIGIAIGGYGLSQALFQLPFGFLSDRFNRKIIIAIGIFIFIIGSVIAAKATSISFLIIGRILQGVGAVGSSTLALITDYTRESERTKAMAIIGASIGFFFALALIIGPVLHQWLAIAQLFEIAALLGFLCWLILLILPSAAAPNTPQERFPITMQLRALFNNKRLLQLSNSIFILHALFTAGFVALPLILKQRFLLNAPQQWQIYLPSLLMGIALILPLLRKSHNKTLSQKAALFMPFLIAMSYGGMWLSTFITNSSLLFIILPLSIFFAAFNFLEASLPAEVSIVVPQHSKGTALGFYSCSQFLGIFVGGCIGGWLYGHISLSAILVFCAMLAFIWGIALLFIKRE